MKKIIKTLKWIAVIPAALLGMFVGYLFSFIFSSIFNFGMAPAWIIKLTSNFVSGALFVLSGTFIAPSAKKIVSVVLCTLYIVIAIISAFLALYNKNERMLEWIFYTICSIVGSIVSTWYIYTNKDQNVI